ncbi:MAG: 2-oxoacid:acceptor oxidoreductase subunit alpha [Anaerolineales bacterium]|nr:2-oxoacid:acceptor oxidoreductase subunit alpha [Anaerolineales bacterium]MDW8228082.1 2-oxoacid:acceptor oxidoreductase subunit alpha [Anaerolineales bacterium]
MSDRVINDFSITIATVNGSGSQTANVTLLRALFKMGIPVSGKNLFPSNIQGLPTWYTIRVNKDGFLARRDEAEIVVTLNPASFGRDLALVQPGGAFFYADDIKLPITRNDITVYPMPVKALARAADVSPNLRDYIANMVYVGILAHMLGIDLEKIKQALAFHFKGKEQPIASNFGVIQAAADWAAQNLTKRDPFVVEPMDKTAGLIMTDGNTAAALGAIYGGVQFAAWYPITPASTLAEALNVYLPRLRKKDGKQTYAVLQAEDEISAIGMAVGAGWAGLRAMTSTSGPGLSLMTEYAGLAYFAEIPVVIWDIQRVGPSTGLPTRTAQGDLTMIYHWSHGDTQYVILIPGSVNECFEFGWRAFDIAERLQTPVIVLSDLDLGMNQWMTTPFEYPDQPMDRGKVLWEEDLEKRNGIWARYKDEDGDGIPYRTVPGNMHPASAWFARGTGHDENARYSEDAKTWEANLLRLKKKFETARKLLPTPIVEEIDGAEVGLIAYGSTEPAVQEARFLLERNHGLKTSFLRLRALPCTQEVEQFLQKYARIYIIEANRDGQLRQILSAALPAYAFKLRSACHTDGLPLTARWVKEAILAQEVH